MPFSLWPVHYKCDLYLPFSLRYTYDLANMLPIVRVYEVYFRAVTYILLLTTRRWLILRRVERSLCALGHASSLLRASRGSNNCVVISSGTGVDRGHSEVPVLPRRTVTASRAPGDARGRPRLGQVTGRTAILVHQDHRRPRAPVKNDRLLVGHHVHHAAGACSHVVSK